MSRMSCSFNLQPVHPDVILRIIREMCMSKATGIDDISVESIKLVVDLLLAQITHIINLAITQSQFPTAWKKAKIVPLFKKGSPLEAKNYRHIALPVFSKILEKAVFLQIIDYLNANKLYHPNHHRFLSNHNTVTGIIQMYDIWTYSLEKKQMAGVMMVDLSAAFDMVTIHYFKKN